MGKPWRPCHTFRNEPRARQDWNKTTCLQKGNQKKKEKKKKESGQFQSNETDQEKKKKKIHNILTTGSTTQNAVFFLFVVNHVDVLIRFVSLPVSVGVLSQVRKWKSMMKTIQSCKHHRLHGSIL